MMHAVGTTGKEIIASGKGVNPGRLAGGARGIAAYNAKIFEGRGVFGMRSVYSNPVGAKHPGLIDKLQQRDPASTTFRHPFDGANYRSTATGIKTTPVATYNNTQLIPTLRSLFPEIQPHERGTFFRKKVPVVVKTQFGANKTGVKPDTAFHTVKKLAFSHPAAHSTLDSTKLVNRTKPASFMSTGNMWQNPNASFISGKSNPLDMRKGVGRWALVKKSVV